MGPVMGQEVQSRERLATLPAGMPGGLCWDQRYQAAAGESNCSKERSNEMVPTDTRGLWLRLIEQRQLPPLSAQDVELPGSDAAAASSIVIPG